MAGQVTWAPIGTEIVSGRWVGVPDKYNPHRYFDTFEDAEAFADRIGGRVQVEYTLRAPEGATWSLQSARLEPFREGRAVGSVVVERRYEPGSSYRNGPVFPTPEEAEEEGERQGTKSVQEWLVFRAPDGERFEAFGAAAHRAATARPATGGTH